MDKYNKLEILGKGSFGCAWLVHNSATYENCVIKEISIPQMKVKDKDSAINEIKILSTLRHKNIIRYKEAFIHDRCLCIAMEYADDGDLYTKIKLQNGKLFLELVRILSRNIIDWFVQILIAVKYIHSLHILHRDLKSQNIFLSKSGLVKIGDFGISRFLNGSLHQAQTTVGTPYYLSPEICQQRPYNNKSDMWCLGVLLYELATLRYPFQADNFSSLVVRIIEGKYEPISSCYGPLIQDLVLILLQVEPGERPSASQLLKVPALQPHIKSYLMRVKHKEGTIILDTSNISQKEKQKKRHSLDSVGPDENIVNKDVKSRKRLSFSKRNSPEDNVRLHKLRRNSENMKPLTQNQENIKNGKLNKTTLTKHNVEFNKKSITKKILKPSKVNFIERNRCLAGTTPPTKQKHAAQSGSNTRRAFSTPSSRRSSPENKSNTSSKKKLRNRSHSIDGKALPKQNTPVKLPSSFSSAKESSKVYKIDRNMNMERSSDRKRVSSMQNLMPVDGNANVPCKITKKFASCEDILMRDDYETPILVKSTSQNMLNKLCTPSQTIEKTEVWIQIGEEKKKASQGTCKNSAVKKRHFSVGLPEGMRIPENVKTKIVGRLRAASMTSYNRNLNVKKSDEKAMLLKSDMEQPLHSTLKDENFNTITAAVFPIAKPVDTKTCVRENVSKRTLNKNLCSTYTVLKPTAIHSQLRDVIGKERFEETLRVLQQVRISPKDIQLLNQASGILGDEHRSRLLSLLQITCQQN